MPLCPSTDGPLLRQTSHHSNRHLVLRDTASGCGLLVGVDDYDTVGEAHQPLAPGVFSQKNGVGCPWARRMAFGSMAGRFAAVDHMQRLSPQISAVSGEQ